MPVVLRSYWPFQALFLISTFEASPSPPWSNCGCPGKLPASCCSCCRRLPSSFTPADGVPPTGLQLPVSLQPSSTQQIVPHLVPTRHVSSSFMAKRPWHIPAAEFSGAPVSGRQVWTWPSKSPNEPGQHVSVATRHQVKGCLLQPPTPLRLPCLMAAISSIWFRPFGLVTFFLNAKTYRLTQGAWSEAKGPEPRCRQPFT